MVGGWIGVGVSMSVWGEFPMHAVCIHMHMHAHKHAHVC